MGSGGRGGRGVIQVPLFGLGSARAGVPVPMSYPVLVPAPVPPLWFSLASSCVYATLSSLMLLMPVPLLIPPLLLFRACRFVMYSYTLIQSQHTTVKGKDKYQYPLSIEYLSYFCSYIFHLCSLFLF